MFDLTLSPASGPILIDPALLDPEATRITSVVCPTCDRVNLLKRSLASFIENCRRHARGAVFVVADDSRSADVRAACKSALKTMKREYGAAIWYAGLEEKVRYAKRLIERGGIEPAVVKFALFDSERTGLPTHGANRNALLLQTCGEAILSFDDDTVGRVAEAPQKSDELLFVPDQSFDLSRHCDIWIFPDREAALRSGSFVEADILARHEEILGRRVTQWKGGVNCDGLSGVESEIPAPPGESTGPGGRVLLTFNGVIGDGGWGAPHVYLLLTGSSLERLTRSESEYRSACLSREMLRVSRCLILTDDAGQTPGTFFGLWNKELTPPFFPIGRSEDIVFWRTLSQSFDDGYAAHLPWALQHWPDGVRSFAPGEVAKGAQGVALSTLLLALFPAADTSPESRQGEKLHRLGRYLQDVGALSGPEFESMAHTEVLREAEAFISYLENLGMRDDDRAGFWADDVRQLSAVLRRSVLRPEFSLPLDLTYGRGIQESRDLSRLLVRRFGELLCWWPTILEVAQSLRADGETLAQPV